MTTNKHRSAAEEVLATLDADATLIEHYDPVEIEALPIADIRERLAELELSPTMPATLKDAIEASAPSPAAEVLGFLEEDVEEFSSVECQPLADVTSRLQELGVNYRSGTNEIADLVRRRASVHQSRVQEQAALHKLEKQLDLLLANCKPTLNEMYAPVYHSRLQEQVDKLEKKLDLVLEANRMQTKFRRALMQLAASILVALISGGMTVGILTHWLDVEITATKADKLTPEAKSRLLAEFDRPAAAERNKSGGAVAMAAAPLGDSKPQQGIPALVDAAPFGDSKKVHITAVAPGSEPAAAEFHEQADAPAVASAGTELDAAHAQIGQPLYRGANALACDGCVERAVPPPVPAGPPANVDDSKKVLSTGGTESHESPPTGDVERAPASPVPPASGTASAVVLDPSHSPFGWLEGEHNIIPPRNIPADPPVTLAEGPAAQQASSPVGKADKTGKTVITAAPKEEKDIEADWDDFRTYEQRRQLQITGLGTAPITSWRAAARGIIEHQDEKVGHQDEILGLLGSQTANNSDSPAPNNINPDDKSRVGQRQTLPTVATAGQAAKPTGAQLHDGPRTASVQGSGDSAQSCVAAAKRLDQLRADPKQQDVIRFAHDLTCEALVPQVLRLLESVGASLPALARTKSAPGQNDGD